MVTTVRRQAGLRDRNASSIEPVFQFILLEAATQARASEVQS